MREAILKSTSSDDMSLLEHNDFIFLESNPDTNMILRISLTRYHDSISCPSHSMSLFKWLPKVIMRHLSKRYQTKTMSPPHHKDLISPKNAFQHMYDFKHLDHNVMTSLSCPLLSMSLSLK